MIIRLYHLDGRVEHRKAISSQVPAVLVRPKHVVFAADGPSSMRELGPRERASMMYLPGVIHQ